MIALILVTAISGGPTVAAATQPPCGFVRDPDFWVATSANLVGAAYFVARVHAPSAEPVLGAGTELMGIPALTFSVSDIAHKKTDFSTWAGIGYATWALGAATIDHVLKVQYRDPAKPAILVPYVVGYYAAVGCLSAAHYRKGWLPWAIAGGTCLLDVAASFYARAKGADKDGR